MSRKTKKVIWIVIAILVVAGIAGGITANILINKEHENAYAAKVNGVEIKESRVTKYIESLRKSYGYESEKSWAEYLNSAGSTPSEMRSNILDTYIKQEIVKQFANEKECEATDDKINETVDKMKENYSTDDAWKKALESAGFESEDDYRDSLKYSIAYKNLEDKFKEEVEVNDETLLEKLPDNLSSYDGAKRSSHILFAESDQEKAQSILDQINAGTLDFAEAAKENSTDTGSAENGGDVGWDKLTTFVDEYTNALKELSVGQVSGLVKSQYGYHIIKCTDEFKKPKEITSLDQVPSEIREKVRENLQSSDSTTNLNNWIDEKKDSSDVEKKDMPDWVSYNCNYEKYMTDEQKKAAEEKNNQENQDSNSDNSENSDDSSNSGDNNGDSNSENSGDNNSDSNDNSQNNESSDTNNNSDNSAENTDSGNSSEQSQ